MVGVRCQVWAGQPSEINRSQVVAFGRLLLLLRFAASDQVQRAAGRYRYGAKEGHKKRNAASEQQQQYNKKCGSSSSSALAALSSVLFPAKILVSVLCVWL